VIFSLLPPDGNSALQWLKTQGIQDGEAVLAAAAGAPIAALELAKLDESRRRFLERLRDPAFDVIALADQCQSNPLSDLVTWLQHWSYDLLLARLTGDVRYNLKDKEAILVLSRRCGTEKIASYWRYLARTKNLVEHPLNPKLFVEDLLLQYRGLIVAP
jgi:DNA polymerase-3 subunit delta'